jgi:hypothetical protein
MVERNVRRTLLEEAVSPAELAGLARAAGFALVSIEKVAAGFPVFMVKLRK